MSIMSKIRNNLALVAAVILLAILAFVVQDLISRGINQSGGSSDVGEIAGQKISYREYAERYSRYLENARSQGSEMTESYQSAIQDQAWDEFVKETVYAKEFERIGLKITPAELADLFVGRNIHPQVQSQFAQVAQQQGKTVPDFLREYIQQTLPQQTPEIQQAFKDFEKYIKEDRARTRFGEMVKAGYLSSKALASQKYMEQNRRFDIAFLGVNYAVVPDSSIKLSNSDYQRYISENKNLKAFKQEESADISLVVIPIGPNGADSTKTFNDARRRMERLAAQNDTIGILKEIGEFPEAARDAIVRAPVGQAMGPVLADGGYESYKVIRSKDTSAVWASVNHILIRPKGFTAADSAAARESAAKIAQQARSGTDFASLVMEHSDDFATKMNGGKLGWYTRGSYGEDFDNAVAASGPGGIAGPVKSRDGYHVIQVGNRTNKLYAVAISRLDIIAGDNTVRDINKTANLLLAAARQTGSLDSAAVQYKLQALSAPALTKASRNLPGVNSGARQVILWALKASKGEVSELFETNGAYIIAQCTKRASEGTKSIEDLKPQIERQVMNRKKAEIILKKLNSVYTPDLNAILQAYGPGAFVDNATGVSFSANSIDKIGEDPKIVGKVCSMKVGDISGPIESKNGIFVVQVLNIAEPAEPTEDELARQMESDRSAGRSSLYSMGGGGKIEQALKANAGIKDDRYKVGF